MKRNALAMTIALCMLAMVFAGCAQNGTANQTTAASVPPSQAPTQEAQSSEPAATPGEQEPIEYEIFWVPWGDAPEEEGLYPQTYMQEKFHVKYKIVQFDPEQKAQQLSTMLASGEVPDFISGSLAELSNYVSKRFVREIPMDLVKEQMPLFYQYNIELDKNIFTYATFDGKLYALPQPNAAGQFVSAIIFRKDWLDAVGSAVPATLDELQSVLTKFVNEDPDGNGKKDTYGLSSSTDQDVGAWFTPVFGAYGAIPGMWMEKDGAIVNGYAVPGFVDAVKLLRSWYASGIIDPEFVTDAADDRSGGPGDLPSKFAKGRIGMLYHLGASEYTWADHVIDPAEAVVTARWQQYNKDWEAAGFDGAYAASLGISGPGGAGVVRNGVSGLFGMIGALVDDGKLERLLQIVEAVSTDPETYTRAASGEENVHWTWYETTSEYSVDGKSPLWSEEANKEFSGELPKNLTKIGTSSFFNPWINWTFHMYPYWAGEILGNRRVLGEKIAMGAAYESPIKVVLPSAQEYPDLNTAPNEFIIKAITGEYKDIDAEYAKMLETWTNNGGKVLTEEANAIYKK